MHCIQEGRGSMGLAKKSDWKEQNELGMPKKKKIFKKGVENAKSRDVAVG